MDIDIELLQLNINDAFGHEHRIGPIAERAAEILAHYLEDRPTSTEGGSLPAGSNLDAGTVNLNLNRMSDEHAALSIAGAWVEALNAKWESGV